VHTIVVRNVPEADIRALHEAAAERGISVNDVLLEMIKEHVEQYQRMKARREAA
jgi:predicted HicB family RNase H-like nuclease